MSLKRVKILGVFLVFGLSVGLHFLYDFIPNIFTSIIAPVNESIWEHMKLIYSSFIIYGIVEFLIFRKKLEFNNFLLQLFFVPFIGIITYLILFLPLYNIFGENMFISIGLLALVIIFEEVISYFMLERYDVKYGNLIGIVGIILGYFVFGLLTYNPIESELFIDPENKTYGIEK